MNSSIPEEWKTRQISAHVVRTAMKLTQSYHCGSSGARDGPAHQSYTPRELWQLEYDWRTRSLRYEDASLVAWSTEGSGLVELWSISSCVTIFRYGSTDKPVLYFSRWSFSLQAIFSCHNLCSLSFTQTGKPTLFLFISSLLRPFWLFSRVKIPACFMKCRQAKTIQIERKCWTCTVLRKLIWFATRQALTTLQSNPVWSVHYNLKVNPPKKSCTFKLSDFMCPEFLKVTETDFSEKKISCRNARIAN